LWHSTNGTNSFRSSGIQPTRRKVAIMIKTPLYMTIEEFSEVLLNNVYATNAFDPDEKYHPTDLAATFALSAEITGATMDQVIANIRGKLGTNGTD
jgi:hypothetical protein